MASQKQSKIAQIVREFAKQGDSYDITGINLGLAKYFWREAQGTFNDLATGDYRIDTANGRQTLVVTNQSVVGLMESIQVAYILDFDASSYDTKWNVDINTLKDKYNQLVSTCSGLWEYIRSVGMVADDTTMSLILPQLDTDEIWIKTDTGYTALKVTDFRDMAGASLIEYMKTEKANINQINKHAVESLNTVRDNGITEINNSIGDITAHVDGIELDLTTFLETLKKSLNTYFNLLNATMLVNQKKLEDTLKQVPVQTNEIKNVGKNERVSVMQEGQKQRELLAQDGEQWRDQIKAEADKVLGLESGIQQKITEGKKIDTDLGDKITQGIALDTSLGVKISEVPTLISNINTAGSTQVGNVNSAGTRNVSSVNAEGTKQVKTVSDTGSRQVTAVGNEGNRQVNAIGEKGTEQVNLISQQGDLEIAKVNAQGVAEVGKVTTEGVKQLGIVTSKGDEIVKVANDKITEIKAIKQTNVNYNTPLTEWLGTKTEYDAIGFKTANRRYSIYSDTGAITEQYYWKWKESKEYFDNRISMVFQGGESGYYMYNDPDDPMPINTLNGNGLKVWEETEDYFIYIDKDAVTTSVEKYATGSYQTFLERKADVEGNMELVKSYTTWTHEDDSNLFIKCNDEALEKLTKTPSFIPETGEENPPPVLEPRVVPTTYNCCFRVDRKTGDIYINEGYENLTTRLIAVYGFTATLTEGTITTNPYTDTSSRKVIKLNTNNYLPNADYSFTYNVKQGTQYFTGTTADQQVFTQRKPNNLTKGTISGTTKDVFTGYGDGFCIDLVRGENPKTIIDVLITKTSTPKPFIKTIMPNGKLSFISNATSETHSFVGKGVTRGEYLNNDKTMTRAISFSKGIGERFGFVTMSDMENSFVYSTNFNKVYPSNASVIVNGKGHNLDGIILFGLNYGIGGYSFNSFKQFLIYKGNLTEQELNAENAKEIILR